MKNSIIYTIIGVIIVIAVIAGIAYAHHTKEDNMDQAKQAQNSTASSTASSANSTAPASSTPAVTPTPASTPSQPASSNTTAQAVTLPDGYTVPTDCQGIDFKNSVAVLNTTLGTIKIQMYFSDAPITVVNFDCLVHRGYYNGIIFHRILQDLAIQGGDPTGTGSGGQSAYGKPFIDELNPNTASYKNGYTAGTVAMANSGPNTNGSQFFVIPTDQAKQAFSMSYTIFGKVISGMDVVAKMNAEPINPVNGPGDGSPITKIVITSATLESASAQ
jgi:cyclophilin family peptidyl-prolyl cis-trans isomerase